MGDYCTVCGSRLEDRFLETEGRDIPFCPTCQQYRFPMFNTAVSMIVMNESKDKIVLIKQYNKDRFILVAGYVNHGENVESAVIREVKEEMGLTVSSMEFNKSEYYEPSNTLMINFAVTVTDECVHENEEIDSYEWFTISKARDNIYSGSLAERFLLHYLDQKNKENCN
ncbi:MAG: NUDIX domain-containing protein [Lachnospiraceae bacterium]|nr:NUDIX domain-containing protein [Lachnospiraceae bacterium]